jgi:hypothetical protein
VTPNYRYSKQARQAPLREVDIDRHGTGGWKGGTGQMSVCLG